MGSGKSTAGKKLAKKMEYEFIDMDAFIEAEAGKSIPEIFKLKGEAAFREMEKEALSVLSKKENVVVSCGGGTPCFHDNMDVMNKTGVSVYLKLSVDVLVSRLITAKQKRPLIANKTEDELKSFIARQLKTRDEFYGQAQLIVEGKSLNVDEFVALLQSKLT